MRRLILVSLALAAVAAVLLRSGGRQATQAAPSEPELALLSTRGLATETTLRFLRAGAERPGDPVASFTHLPDATVRGALLPGSSTVLATADRALSRDHSFDAALLRVEAGREAVELCDRVDHAARPLVDAAGRVFVGRGRPGPTREGALRLDALTLDEIDAATGVARTLVERRGYHLSAVAAAGGRIIAYLVDASGASLLSIDPGAPAAPNGSVRALIADLAPFARDFSVVGDALVFSDRDEQRRDLWVIDAVDLASGARRRLLRSPVQHLAPHAWPGGELAFDAGRGLSLLRGGGRQPLGSGVDVVRALSPDGRLAALWHYPPETVNPEVAILDATGRVITRVAPPDDATRLEIVGFTGSAR